MANCLEYRDVYGYSISSNEPQWNGSASSVDALTASGYYTFRISRSAVGIVIGLAREARAEGYTHIEFGLYCNRGTFQVIESGVLVTAPVSFSVDAVFHIVRASEIIYYCISSIFENTHPTLPGTPFAVSAKPSYGTYYLDAALYNTDDTVISMSYNELGSQRGSAAGRFMVKGLSSTAAINNSIGFFKASGSATGYMLTSASGRFAIGGLSANYAYSEAHSSFTITGSASSMLHPTVSGSLGILEFDGSASGSQYYPVTINGYFRVAGKASKNPYYEASSGFRIFGISGGGRAAPANYFNIALRFTDSLGEDYIARFAPIKVFPSYTNEHGYFVINKADLPAILDTDPTTDWPHVIVAMFTAVKDTYDALDSLEQPEAARPWILSSSDVITGSGGLSVTEVRDDEVEFSFVLQPGTMTLVEDT